MRLKVVLHQPNIDDQTLASDLILSLEDIPLVEFMYLVFTRMPCESYSRRLRSLLLYLCYVFGALINSLVCRFKVCSHMPPPACSQADKT